MRASFWAGVGEAQDSNDAGDAFLETYKQECPEGFVEPLLRPDRFHFGHVTPGREAVEELYIKARASFWSEHENYKHCVSPVPVFIGHTSERGPSGNATRM